MSSIRNSLKQVLLLGALFSPLATGSIASAQLAGGSPEVFPPPFSLKVVDGVAAEPGTDLALIDVIRNGDTNRDVVVSYSVYGTASNGVDYVALPGKILIPAGTRTARITVEALDDALVEPRESVVILLGPMIADSPTASGSSYSGRAEVVIYDNDNIPPRVELLSPAAGSIHRMPTNVLLSARAVDATDWVRKVAFYANAHMVGSVAAGDTNVIASFRWMPMEPGRYVVQAKAWDNVELMGVSATVTILVERVSLPVVSIMTLDGHAGEAGPDPGAFLVKRSGDTNMALTVAYSLTGRASNGVDYVALPGSVELPAGRTSATLDVLPIDDALEELTETVEIGLQRSPAYALGTQSKAVVYIMDNDANQPPAVRLTDPLDGAVFVAPAMIPVAAEAKDPDGRVAKVVFMANERTIGVATNPPFSTLWKQEIPGFFLLVAKATDDRGATGVSQPVRVTVKAPPPPPPKTEVRRRLPFMYVPGVPVSVYLKAHIVTNIGPVTVVDCPPEGWGITAVSDGGVIDPALGCVTFPDVDPGRDIGLKYVVLPPADAEGDGVFEGVWHAGSVTNPITGCSVIRAPPLHPADNTPTNRVMTAGETDVYAALWRMAAKPDAGPYPIPLNYVTRAGYLSSGPGPYTFSTNRPTVNPPLVWVREAGELVPAPWATNGWGTADRMITTSNSIGAATWRVTLRIDPPSGVSAVGVEERPPKGWKVTSVSPGGVYSPLTGTIRWGLMFGDGLMELSYQTSPASNLMYRACFSGVVSMDGVNRPIRGWKQPWMPPMVDRPPPPKPQVDAKGMLVFSFTGEPGTFYVIEGSSDMKCWVPRDVLLNSDGVLQYGIDPAGRNAPAYLRAVPQDAQ